MDAIAFSRQGLIDQLEYNGYSAEEATYAVDSLKADWNAEAVRRVEEYPGTKQETEDALVEDGFTPEQVAYGLETYKPKPATPEVLVEELEPITSIGPDGTTRNSSGHSAAGVAEVEADIGFFSQRGLIEYLVEAHGFPVEEATEAVNALEVDWNKKAEEMAQAHMTFRDVSDADELRTLLENDGFTPEQVESGLASVGFWQFW